MYTTVICSDTKEVSYMYRDYLLTRHWMEFRRKYIEKFGRDCEIWGKEGSQLHHLNHMTLGNEDFEDVIFVCGECHEKEHIYDLNKL